MKENPALFQALDLRQYKSPQLLTQKNIDLADTLQIPPNWIMAIKSDSVNDALEKIWGSDEVGKVFKSTLYEIDGIAILTSENLAPSLIYWWEDGNDIWSFEGQLPLEETNIPDDLEPFYEKLPNNFKKMYKTHNGLQLGGMGILAVQDWDWEGEDWDPGIEIHYKLNLDELLRIFYNGAGIDLCLDQEYNAVYFDHKNPKKPRFNVNFWNELSHFLNMHFEGGEPHEDPVSSFSMNRTDSALTSEASNENLKSQTSFKNIADLDFPFTVKVSVFEIVFAVLLLIVFGIGLTVAGVGLLILSNVDASFIIIFISCALILIGIFVSVVYLFTYVYKTIFYKDSIKKFHFMGRTELKPKDISSISLSYRSNGERFIEFSTSSSKNMEVNPNHTAYDPVDLCEKLQSLYANHKNNEGSG